MFVLLNFMLRYDSKRKENGKRMYSVIYNFLKFIFYFFRQDYKPKEHQIVL